MKFPTPLKGWRVFAGEVGVIVLGVLLALGAQQLAENLQMRGDVREFRRTIDHEIGLNLFIYDVRSRGSGCNRKRIKQLTDWVKAARPGDALPQIWPKAPIVLTPYRSAWENRDGAVFNHLPLKDRQKYAEFYDELDHNWEMMSQEMNEWFALQRYALPGPVSQEDLRTLYGHLRMVYVIDNVWADNMTISSKIAQELGVKAIRPDNVSQDTLAQVTECPSVFMAPTFKLTDPPKD